MQTKVQKWGNSLALRIPKSFADEVGLHGGTAVDLSLVGGKLVISIAEERRYTLNQLLANVTEDNLHSEQDSGPALGDEVW